MLACCEKRNIFVLRSFNTSRHTWNARLISIKSFLYLAVVSANSTFPHFFNLLFLATGPSIFYLLWVIIENQNREVGKFAF